MPVQRPEDIHRRFADAANAGDITALAALYESDAVIIERDGTTTSGTSAIRSHLEDLTAMKPRMEIIDSRVFGRGEIALLCSRWRANVTPPGGSEVTMEFRGSEIARQQDDGTWLLLIDNPWGVDLVTAHAATA